MPTNADLLIAKLAAEGVRHIFTVPSESLVPALNALHGRTDMRAITCRNEAAAAMMAEADGKLTGRIGVAMVARGPGAANAAAGVYIAHQDETPLLLLVGLPPRAELGQEIFQAVDIERLFSGISKWCAIVHQPERLSDTLSRAVRFAMSGRPGPVIIGLPEDVLSAACEAIPAQAATRVEPAGPQAAKLAEIKAALAHAERPLVVVGGARWSEEASQNLALFAERFDLPVVSAFRRQDHFDNRHRCYCGHLGLNLDRSLAAGLRAADVVIAVGARLTGVSAQGFSVFERLGGKLFCIAPDADAADAPYPGATAVPASPPAAALALAHLELPGKTPPWGIWRRDLRQAYISSLNPEPTPGRMRLEDAILHLSQTLPEPAIICSGAGNYASFLHRYFAWKEHQTQLAPACGSMGYGLPAAIAAKLAFPVRPVVALAGDGCFQMTGAELATAVQFALPIVIIIANNGALGTIRAHQEQHYPGRVVGTSLLNPDFAALAESYGAMGIRVTDSAEFPDAFARALAANGPAVIELVTELEAISPGRTLSQMRGTAAKS